MSDALQEWFAAVKAGDLAAVERRLAADPSLASARDADGLSSVMWACYARQERVRERLLAGRPALDLFEASAAGDADVVRRLLAQDASAARSWSPDGFTALHLAAFFGHAAIAEALLDAGADPVGPARNAMHVAPLHSAAAAGANDVARTLLARGANPNARQTQGFTALMSAAQQGNAALVEMLLADGADPASRCDDGRAAADFADQQGHHGLAARLRGG